MFDPSIRAASIEDAIASLGTATELLQGCGCDDDIEDIAATENHLRRILSATLSEIGNEYRETEAELTRHYYRQR